MYIVEDSDGYIGGKQQVDCLLLNRDFIYEILSSIKTYTYSISIKSFFSCETFCFLFVVFIFK